MSFYTLYMDVADDSHCLGTFRTPELAWEFRERFLKPDSELENVSFCVVESTL